MVRWFVWTYVNTTVVQHSIWTLNSLHMWCLATGTKRPLSIWKIWTWTFMYWCQCKVWPAHIRQWCKGVRKALQGCVFGPLYNNAVDTNRQPNENIQTFRTNHLFQKQSKNSPGVKPPKVFYVRKAFRAFEGLFLSLWNFASCRQPAFTLRHSDIKDLSRPLASYPDTQSTHRFREEIHKGLMDPQCRTIPDSVTQKTNKEAQCSLQSKNTPRGLECGDLWRGWLSQSCLHFFFF